jgi:hypothetical protein
MQKGNNVEDDPKLINVSRHVKKLEREVDDIIWDHGVHDKRLPMLYDDLKHFKNLEQQGILYEPKF